MSEAFPSVPERAAQEQFSQVEKYQELAQKLGVTEADKEGARFNGSFTLQPGDTLSKKLLEHYGVNADGRRKMASMLVQMAQAGFNVDFVKAGETLNFKGNEVEVVKHNGEKIVLNLDGGSAEIKDESRRAIEGVTRDVAAGLALEIYNLYLTAQAGGDVGNWEEQKGDFIEAVVKIIEFAASATPEQGEKLNFVEGQFAKIAEAEAAHGKGSAEYNIAIINLIKEFKGQMNEEQMAEFWDWVTQYVKEKVDHKSEPIVRPESKERAPERQTFEQFKVALDAAFDEQLQATFGDDAKYVAFDLKVDAQAEYKSGQWYVDLPYTLTRTDNGEHIENGYSVNFKGTKDDFRLDAQTVAQAIIGANSNTIPNYMAQGSIDAVLKAAEIKTEPIDAKEYKENLRHARQDLNAIIRKDPILKAYYQAADFTYDKKEGRGEFMVKYTSVDAADKRTTHVERLWATVDKDRIAEIAARPYCVNLKPQWIAEFYTIRTLKEKATELAEELKAKAARGELVKASDLEV